MVLNARAKSLKIMRVVVFRWISQFSKARTIQQRGEVNSAKWAMHDKADMLLVIIPRSFQVHSR